MNSGHLHLTGAVEHPSAYSVWRFGLDYERVLGSDHCMGIVGIHREV